MTFALDYWHWFFLAQPHPLPENMIGANPDNYYFRYLAEEAPDATYAGLVASFGG